MCDIEGYIEKPLDWVEKQIIDKEKQLPAVAQRKQLPAESVDDMAGLGSCVSGYYSYSPGTTFIPESLYYRGQDLFQRRQDIKDAIEVASGIAETKEEIRRRREMASSWIDIDRFTGFPVFCYQLDSDEVVHLKAFAAIRNIKSTRYFCKKDEAGIWVISWETRKNKRREACIKDAELSENKLRDVMIKRGVNMEIKQMKGLAWEAFLAWITENASEKEIHSERKSSYFIDGSFRPYQGNEISFEELRRKCC